jgi:hypothetical protein
MAGGSYEVILQFRTEENQVNPVFFGKIHLAIVIERQITT